MAGAGQLRERIAIQEEVQTVDDAGGYSVVWSTLATVWARVQPTTGNEQLEAGKLEGSTRYKITMRDRSITTDMRLVWNSVPLNVRSVINPDERGRFIEILCDQGVAV